MKKIILSAALCSGVLLASAATMTVAHADDELKGTTTVTSEVTRGERTLTVDPDTGFDKKPLAAIVDFGTKTINYNLTDYSGHTDGFTILAKLEDKDEKRVLTLAGKELSDTPEAIATKATNAVGDNKDSADAKLVYTGLTDVKVYTSKIEWSVQPTTALLAE